jgi:hypothetical protein
LRTAGIENRCPVCQARFRGARICSRCGADLEPLMLLAVKAWQLRQAARQALDAGDVQRALALAIEAQGTPRHRERRGVTVAGRVVAGESGTAIWYTEQFGRIAQLVRASGLHPEGQWFDPTCAHHPQPFRSRTSAATVTPAASNRPLLRVAWCRFHIASRT